MWNSEYYNNLLGSYILCNLVSEKSMYVRFESITFVRTKESTSKLNAMQQNTGLVEAIILEVKDREKIGGSSLKSNVICCNPGLADTGACKLGEVIIKRSPDNHEWPKRIQTFFQGNKEEVKMTYEEVEISSTGMYYLYFMFCDPQLKGTLMKGRTVWKNPDGYLPGKMAPLMTFYGFMSLAYLLLGLIWFLRFVQFWKDILQLHYHITAVIALGMCEMAVWYFEYANFNSTGSRPMGITLWAVTFSSVKKTLSRLLLLVVSMGYGVVKPTLGGITYKLYFNATDPLSELWQLAWIIPAFWTLLAYTLLGVICALWAPSQNPTRYAYLEETGEEIDEEGIALTGGVPKVGGDMAVKLERKERKGPSGLVEDLEEDKRE
ncbi:Transmembrane protein 87B [Morella rubra]|uniref:Transmembrane protein 87B n=1 Tax=Morella rubra TaxID=262757 RepID=A0A6A1WLP2_9ROSI|nr:Transmembrane protein 87B [Morella rubra]